MALRKIVKVGDECLNKKCRPVTEFNDRLHALLDDMQETLTDAAGAGLAAPQVGVLRRICIVLDERDYSFMELINPEIVGESGEQTGVEGCLSLPGEYGVVTRPMYVTVRAQDRNGDWYEYDGEELVARCFCHEIDHLDGHMYTEIAEKMLTPEELEQMVAESDDYEVEIEEDKK